MINVDCKMPMFTGNIYAQHVRGKKGSTYLRPILLVNAKKKKLDKTTAKSYQYLLKRFIPRYTIDIVMTLSSFENNNVDSNYVQYLLNFILGQVECNRQLTIILKGN